MFSRRAALALSAALTAASLALGMTPATAESVAKFSDAYKGYHLRPPYYLPGIGWHHPPKHRISRAYYFGYHHHPTPGPKVYRQAAQDHPARSAAMAWCQARYRSYRAADNTFQPLQGPRRQCCPPHR